jgi:hypothetical protein
LYLRTTTILLALVGLSVQANLLQDGEDDIVKVQAVNKVVRFYALGVLGALGAVVRKPVDQDYKQGLVYA